MPELFPMATTVPEVRIPRREPPPRSVVRSTSTQWSAGSIFSQGGSERSMTWSAESTTRSGEPCQNCTRAPVRCRNEPGSGFISPHEVRRQRPVGSITSPLRTVFSSPLALVKVRACQFSTWTVISMSRAPSLRSAIVERVEDFRSSMLANALS